MRKVILRRTTQGTTRLTVEAPDATSTTNPIKVDLNSLVARAKAKTKSTGDAWETNMLTLLQAKPITQYQEGEHVVTRYPEGFSVLNQDQRQILEQEHTHFEDIFFLKLIRRLQLAHYQGEVHRGVLFYWNGTEKRPDLYIPGLGLVIEIDGAGHDQSERILKIDGERDGYYSELGLQLLRIPNYWIGNEGKINRVIDELFSAFIPQDVREFRLSDLHRYADTNKKLFLGRRKYLKDHPQVRFHKGRATINDPQDLAIAFHGYHFYGGKQVVIRPTKKRRERHRQPKSPPRT